jgi:hypothetical protein
MTMFERIAERFLAEQVADLTEPCRNGLPGINGSTLDICDRG